MEIIETPLMDCCVIKNQLHGNERGFFLESFNYQSLSEKGIDFHVKQINFAKSGKNVLRGLHYQKSPMSQSKLVGVISGSVIDVAVDIRPKSPSYLKYFKMELKSPDTLLYIPKGFAHGYYTKEENTVFYYAVDEYYSPENEGGIHYKDKTLNIDWGNIENAVISPKDLKQPQITL